MTTTTSSDVLDSSARRCPTRAPAVVVRVVGERGSTRSARACVGLTADVHCRDRLARVEPLAVDGPAGAASCRRTGPRRPRAPGPAPGRRARPRARRRTSMIAVAKMRHTRSRELAEQPERGMARGPRKTSRRAAPDRQRVRRPRTAKPPTRGPSATADEMPRHLRRPNPRRRYAGTRPTCCGDRPAGRRFGARSQRREVARST